MSIIKFRKVPELFPDRKVRRELLWFITWHCERVELNRCDRLTTRTVCWDKVRWGYYQYNLVIISRSYRYLCA